MFPRRVVVTGFGAVTPIGNNESDIRRSLFESISGVEFNPVYADYGFRSQVRGVSQSTKVNDIPRKIRRFMGQEAEFAYVAALDAISVSGLDESIISHDKTGLIMGSGGASTSDIVAAADRLREHGIKRVGPYRVTATMTNTVSACLSTSLGIKGLNFSVSSACATSAHCIGIASQMIAWGEQEVIIAGGAESEHWSQTALFDAMQAMSSKYNSNPASASRPYDQDRDGFVIASGAGAVILESYEHALARGATIIAELTGYGTASDGDDMVAPSGKGSEAAIRSALKQHHGLRCNPIDYVNTHATSTPAGDCVEVEAMARAFNNALPMFSSTKSLTGHALGAAGVHEVIYSLIMLKNNFLAASANIENLDVRIQGKPIVLESMEKQLLSVMSNSFGFGGTNVSLIFSKIKQT
jgi:3-oxoacyl-[acyl-carrier-protein] synthase-1